MIILSTQYDGMNDLLETALEFNTDAVHISAELKQSFKDIVASLGIGKEKFLVNYLSPFKEIKSGLGYYPLENGMFINRSNFKGLIVTHTDNLEKLLDVFSEPLDFLLLSKLKLNLKDKITLERSNSIDYLICSKIEQYSQVDFIKQGKHKKIIDLNRNRMVQLK